jgi:transposase
MLNDFHSLSLLTLLEIVAPIVLAFGLWCKFPEHLPRRRIVHPAPTSCPCCGGTKLSKIGEDVTETLDVIPRQWFITEHVREKFSCRSCETITQPPAPSTQLPGALRDRVCWQ